MTGDFSKNYAAKRARAKPSRRSRVLIGLITLIVVVGGYFAYQYKSGSLRATRLSSTMTHMTAWVSDHKNNLHKKITTVKQIAVNDADEPQQLHFEFYTALTNGRGSGDVVKVETMTATSPPAQALPPKVATNVKKHIVSADELEREFSTELKKQKM